MADCVVMQIPNLVPAPGTSASPGFQFGRAGDISAGTYLKVLGDVPSSTAGFIVPFNGVMTRAFVTNESANTFDIKIQKRTDPGPVFTDVTTLSIVAARKASFVLSESLTDGDEIVILVSSGSCRNVQVGFVAEQI